MDSKMNAKLRLAQKYICFHGHSIIFNEPPKHTDRRFKLRETSMMRAMRTGQDLHVIGARKVPHAQHSLAQADLNTSNPLRSDDMIDKKESKDERNSHVNTTYQCSSSLFEESTSTDTLNCLEGVRVRGWYWSDDLVPIGFWLCSSSPLVLYHTKNKGLDLDAAQPDPLLFPFTTTCPLHSCSPHLPISTTSPPLL
jgi:hypothetical protein